MIKVSIIRCICTSRQMPSTCPPAATVTATPSSGYTFINWTGSATNNSPTYTFTATGNTSLTANFRTTHYSPKSGDVMVKSGLATTMPTQLINTCVTAIMEYINNNVFNGSVNEGVYQLSYYVTYGQWVIDDGVSLSDIVSFTNMHFTTNTFSSLQAAISSGAVIMTNIASSIPNSSHNVVIVGYFSDGYYIYMDSETGHLCIAHESAFLKNYVLYITGTK